MQEDGGLQHTHTDIHTCTPKETQNKGREIKHVSRHTFLWIISLSGVSVHLSNSSLLPQSLNPRPLSFFSVSQFSFLSFSLSLSLLIVSLSPSHSLSLPRSPCFRLLCSSRAGSHKTTQPLSVICCLFYIPLTSHTDWWNKTLPSTLGIFSSSDLSWVAALIRLYFPALVTNESSVSRSFWLSRLISVPECPCVRFCWLTSSFPAGLAGCLRAAACGRRTTWRLGLWSCCSWSRGGEATFWFAAGRCRPPGSPQSEVPGGSCHPRSSQRSEQGRQGGDRDEKRGGRQKSETTEPAKIWDDCWEKTSYLEKKKQQKKNN